MSSVGSGSGISSDGRVGRAPHPEERAAERSGNPRAEVGEGRVWLHIKWGTGYSNGRSGGSSGNNGDERGADGSGGAQLTAMNVVKAVGWGLIGREGEACKDKQG